MEWQEAVCYKTTTHANHLTQKLRTLQLLAGCIALCCLSTVPFLREAKVQRWLLHRTMMKHGCMWQRILLLRTISDTQGHLDSMVSSSFSQNPTYSLPLPVFSPAVADSHEGRLLASNTLHQITAPSSDFSNFVAEGIASVVDLHDGSWHHINMQGNKQYSSGSWAWCGNFQEGRCTVRIKEGVYFHIDAAGVSCMLCVRFC